MAKAGADQVYQQGDIRYFYQTGGESGAGPHNKMNYGGLESQYFYLDDIEEQVTGGTTAITVHDPANVGEFVSVGAERSAPERPTTTLHFLQKMGAIPAHLHTLARRCPMTVYELAGRCGDLGDVIRGWERGKVLSNMKADTVTHGGQGGWASDGAIEDQMDVTMEDVYMFGQLVIGAKAFAETTTPVKGVTFGANTACSTCGNGNERVYLVEKGTYSAFQIVYTTDGGNTWVVDTDLVGGSSADVPLAIAVTGGYLVVLCQFGSNDSCYYFYGINPETGAPSDTGTRITTGFVTNFTAKDMYALSPREIFITAKDGYLYKIESLRGGVTVIMAQTVTNQDLNRIHGRGNTLVAVGDGGTVVVSRDRGRQWVLTTTEPNNNNLGAVAVLGELRYWAGTVTGGVYYTDDGGETWSLEIESLINVHDIVFATPEMGYVLGQAFSPLGTPVLLATINGGRDWSGGPNRIKVFNPTSGETCTRIAVPRGSVSGINANSIAIAGGVTAGVLYMGTAPEV